MYQVILIGVREDVARAAAAKNLATLFNATPEQVEKMLANSGYVLKRGIAEDVALKYKGAIEAAGGTCQVVQENPAELTFEVNFTQSATNQENPKNNQQFTNEFAADNRSEATSDNDAHLNNDTEREKTLWQKLLGKSLITKIVLVFGGILILAGLAISLADVVVHKQNGPASKSTATAGIAAENKTPVTLSGVYRMESGNSIVMEIYYPDGAYIESTWVKVNSNDKPMFFSILVGMCRQNGTQLDCRLTGQADAVTALLDGRTDINQKDFRSNESHTEVTDLIRMNNDGSFSKKRIKIVLDGGQPPPLDDKWSDKYIPAHSEDEEKVKNDMRQLVPAQFFAAQQQATVNTMPSPAQQNPPSVQSPEAESKISSDASKALTDMYGGSIWADKRLTGEFNGRGYITPVFEARFTEDGIGKLVVLGHITPRPAQDYVCHACIPLLGGAVFRKQGSDWVIESSQKIIGPGDPMGSGEFSIVNIGSAKHGVLIRIDDFHQGYENLTNEILIPNREKLGVALQVESGDNSGNMECLAEVDFHSGQDIKFEPGKNPEYFDAVVRVRYIEGDDCEQWSRNDKTTKYRFNNGKYEPYK